MVIFFKNPPVPERALWIAWSKRLESYVKLMSKNFISGYLGLFKVHRIEFYWTIHNHGDPVHLQSTWVQPYSIWTGFDWIRQKRQGLMWAAVVGSVQGTCINCSWLVFFYFLELYWRKNCKAPQTSLVDHPSGYQFKLESYCVILFWKIMIKFLELNCFVKHYSFVFYINLSVQKVPYCQFLLAMCIQICSA